MCGDFAKCLLYVVFRAPHESDARRDERELSHQRRRRHATKALERAQQRLRVAPPASPADSSSPSLARRPRRQTRRWVAIRLGAYRKALAAPLSILPTTITTRTSSTSSGGSSTRDLEAKAALWAEYQQRPAERHLAFRVLRPPAPALPEMRRPRRREDGRHGQTRTRRTTSRSTSRPDGGFCAQGGRTATAAASNFDCAATDPVNNSVSAAGFRPERGGRRDDGDDEGDV
ncbi:hypothetical protein B0H14DRAFT_3527937 [Mycena olivaceomarginata]|nr:hypothetical protein B0H14DRAFT_3527937 [Mycena olivaceomarginata]